MKNILAAGIISIGILNLLGCEKTNNAAIENTGPGALQNQDPVAQTRDYIITDAEVGMKAFCVVMKVPFTVSKKTPAAEYKGKIYYFCCGRCPVEFRANPDKYAE